MTDTRYKVNEYILTDDRLVVIRCYKCAMLFALPKAFRDEARRQGEEFTFYCPMGHGQVYRKSEADQLREQLEAERERLKWAREDRDRYRDEKLAVERSLSATKGVVTKMRKRSAAGLCLICNRHFTPLQRHMSTKHPGMADSEE